MSYKVELQLKKIPTTSIIRSEIGYGIIYKHEPLIHNNTQFTLNYREYLGGSCIHFQFNNVPILNKGGIPYDDNKASNQILSLAHRISYFTNTIKEPQEIHTSVENIDLKELSEMFQTLKNKLPKRMTSIIEKVKEADNYSLVDSIDHNFSY